jgi:regulator of protease activity HflC (stomatin/prohibitin superfamily)
MIGLIKFLIMVAAIVIAIIWSIDIKKPASGRPGDIQGWSIKFSLKGIISGIVLFFLLLTFVSCVGTIQAGHRGVVLSFGAVTGKILGEGIYAVVPLVQSVEVMSVRVEAYEAEAASASRDLQEVSTKVTLNYWLDPKEAARVYQTLGRAYENRIIKPAIQEAVKASTAQFDAEKLITERPKIKETIEEYLRARLAVHGLLVDAVSITDFSFSPDFTKAIEAKVTASQLALKAQRDLERVKMEAQQKIEQAKAEAEALRLQKEQVTTQLIQLRQIEVQRQAIERWNGILPHIITGGGTVPFINIPTE